MRAFDSNTLHGEFCLVCRRICDPIEEDKLVKTIMYGISNRKASWKMPKIFFPDTKNNRLTFKVVYQFKIFCKVFSLCVEGHHIKGENNLSVSNIQLKYRGWEIFDSSSKSLIDLFHCIEQSHEAFQLIFVFTNGVRRENPYWLLNNENDDRKISPKTTTFWDNYRMGLLPTDISVRSLK